MVKKREDEYGPDVYRRLELVRKQFKNSVAERKRLESAERRRQIIEFIKKNKGYITRTAVFMVLASLVISVLWLLLTR
jgi:hypothetical protein